VLLVAGLLACAGGGPPQATLPSPGPAIEERDASPAAPARAPCIAAVTPSPPASHNPGTNCIAAGCHDGSTPKAPRWTVAGTLYTDAAGSAPVSGASVEIVDAKGQLLTIATAVDGSFHTADAVSHPLKVRVSRCPGDAPMMGKVFRVESCNQTNCHGASMRMHLP
jgi:hypothetical protein